MDCTKIKYRLKKEEDQYFIDGGALTEIEKKGKKMIPYLEIKDEVLATYLLEGHKIEIKFDGSSYIILPPIKQPLTTSGHSCIHPV